MHTCKLILELLSPIITPFQADTIFGHYAWALRYLNGEQRLMEFLAEMETDPPVFFSDGFPEGFLPRPVLPPFNEEQKKELEKVFRNQKGDKLSFIRSLKILKKVPLIAEETFTSVVSGYSDSELYKKVFCGELCLHNFAPKNKDCAPDGESCLSFSENKKSKCKRKPFMAEDIVAHNTINRLTNSTGAGGGFYQQEETFYAQGQRFVIFIRCQDTYIDEIREVWKLIESGGFGKDKSAGKGHFKIIEDISWKKISLPENERSNAVMSLSCMIPGANDPAGARYNLITKYGKLGGDFAKSAYPGGEALIPFKKPLIMMKAGAVFDWNAADKKTYLGCMMAEVHHYKPIRHYAYGLPLYFHQKNG